MTVTQTQFENDVNRIFPKTEGDGIRVDPDAPTFPFRDLLGPIEVRITGAGRPVWSQVDSTVFWDFKFDVNDSCWLNYHIRHDYAPGTDIFFHIHWFSNGSNVNPVKWQIEYAYADGHGDGVFPLASATTATAEEAPDGTMYTHYVTETSAQTIAMLPDGIIQTRFTRITNGATDNTDDIFVKEADIHYQSTNIGTKNKAPDFYT